MISQNQLIFVDEMLIDDDGDQILDRFLIMSLVCSSDFDSADFSVVRGEDLSNLKHFPHLFGRFRTDFNNYVAFLDVGLFTSPLGSCAEQRNDFFFKSGPKMLLDKLNLLPPRSDVGRRVLIQIQRWEQLCPPPILS